MSRDVFISYASEDRTVAEKICSGFEADGISCWVAPRDILPGDSYADAIIRGIDESEIFVLVFSGHANESPHIIREVERAVHNKAVIIPFLIENVKKNRDFEYFISAPHWLDATTPPIENHIRKLTETVKAQLVRKKTPKPLPSERSEQKQLVSCRVCGARNPGTNQFCRNCGNPLGKVQPVPSTLPRVPDALPPRLSKKPIPFWLIIGIIVIVVAVYIIGISLKKDDTSIPLTTSVDTTVIPRTTMTTSVLPTSPETKITTPEPTMTRGSRIFGTLIYNNESITKYTSSGITMELFDHDTNQRIREVQYDNQNGQYVFTNIPEGKYSAYVVVNSGYPYNLFSAGDYTTNLYLENPDIVVIQPQSEIRQDLVVKYLIRLIKPVDNRQERTMTTDPPEKFYKSSGSPSAELFEWEAVPGAATYSIEIYDLDMEQTNSAVIVDDVVITPQYRPNLERNSPNRFYRLDIKAYNIRNQQIGGLINYYKNGYGPMLDFIVV